MWRLSVFVALAALPGSAQPNNYGDATSWLCRPGQRDACDVDLTTTVIAPGGKLSRETWTADPSGGRTDDIVGDLRGNGGVQAKWGLHLVDVNLAMGNLLDVVGQQSGAWLAKAGSTVTCRFAEPSERTAAILPLEHQLTNRTRAAGEPRNGGRPRSA